MEIEQSIEIQEAKQLRELKWIESTYKPSDLLRARRERIISNLSQEEFAVFIEILNAIKKDVVESYYAMTCFSKLSLVKEISKEMPYTLDVLSDMFDRVVDKTGEVLEYLGYNVKSVFVESRGKYIVDSIFFK